MLDPSLMRWCERVRRPGGIAVAMPEALVVNACITLPHRYPHVKLQFDRRVRIRNYSRLACHLAFPGAPSIHGAHWAYEGRRGTRRTARPAATRAGRGTGRLRALPPVGALAVAAYRSRLRR